MSNRAGEREAAGLPRTRLPRTRLLVSVRDAAEAKIALESGADLIDVKEPSRGSLGAASVNVLRQVLDVVDGRVPVSAALGELHELDLAQVPFMDAGGADKVPHFVSAKLGGPIPDLPGSLQFAKVGLSKFRDNPDWPLWWRDFGAGLPAGCRRVAVVYADDQRAQSPRAEEILAAAIEQHVEWLLVDTFDKSAGMLFDWWPKSRIAAFLRDARQHAMHIVLAGSLTETAIDTLLEMGPDFVAVRGAVCEGARTSQIDGAKVRRLAERCAAAAMCRG